MNSNNRILTIYKSRKTMIDLLEYQDFDVSEYGNFSINEIDAMLSNTQLDMLVKNKKNNQMAYIKYYLDAKQIRPANLEKIIEDLFEIESVLTKKDVLIIITEDEPNETIITTLKYIYEHDGIFVVIHNINRLQYNILNHTLVPQCTILEEKEVEELKNKFNIQKLSQLPEISRFDPQALAICLRPGQVCHFQRESATAMLYEYYRVCV